MILIKPIFEEERKKLNHYYPTEIVPENCWIDKNKIFLNVYDTEPIAKFSVDLKGYTFIDIEPYKNSMYYRDKMLSSKNLNFEETYELYKDAIEKKIRKSIDLTKEWITQYGETHKVVLSVSGGKDSELTRFILEKAYEELVMEKNYRTIAFNTTNETAETYKALKHHYGLTKENIISPKVGWHKFIKENKNYYLPTTLSRYCCSTYKEGQMKKEYKSSEDLLIILGMRSHESNKRSFYDYDLNKSWIDHYSKFPKNKRKPLNVPNNWKRFLPIVEFEDHEVWLAILHYGLYINPMYKLGFNRVGCLICPNMDSYSNYLIIQYYSKQWERWVDIIEKNYEIYNIKKQLKWDIYEYVYDGHWKNFSSLEAKILNRKQNDNDIEYLAYLKGCSEDVARKFYNKECECGKKLNPKETGMYFKTIGMHECNYCLCKNCLCEKLCIDKREYNKIAMQYMNEGCNLF